MALDLFSTPLGLLSYDTYVPVSASAPLTVGELQGLWVRLTFDLLKPTFDHSHMETVTVTVTTMTMAIMMVMVMVMVMVMALLN